MLAAMSFFHIFFYRLVFTLSTRHIVYFLRSTIKLTTAAFANVE